MGAWPALGPYMLEHVLTERRHKDSTSLDALDTLALLELINSADAEVPAAVAAQIPWISRATDAVASVLGQGGRLFYIGAGTSGRLGVLDASECPPTFGVSPDLVQGIIAGGESALQRSVEGAEDDSEAGAQDLPGGLQPPRPPVRTPRGRPRSRARPLT